MHAEIRSYDPKFKRIAASRLRGSGMAHLDEDDIAQELAICEWLQGYQALEWKVAKLAQQAIRKERVVSRGGGMRECELDAQNEPQDRSDTLARIIAIESAEAVQRCVSRLPDDLRKVIVLRFYEGKTIGEIAAITERSPRSRASVAAKLTRAIEMMRDGIVERSAKKPALEMQNA